MKCIKIAGLIQYKWTAFSQYLFCYILHNININYSVIYIQASLPRIMTASSFPCSASKCLVDMSSLHDP